MMMKTNRPSFALAAAAFSLIELVAVTGIMLVIIVMAAPTVFDVLDAGRMSQAADQVYGKFSEARGLALSLNCDVEVRLYRNSAQAADEGISGQGLHIYRITGIVPGDNAAESKFEMMAEGNEVKIPATVQISSDARFTSFWKLPVRKERLQGGPREYVAFRFRPDGSTDLLESSQWTVTLVKHPEADAAQLSKNFIALLIDPVTGYISSFRPE